MERERLFAEAFVRTLNGRESAIEAGYTVRSASMMGSKLLHKPRVQRIMQELRAEREKSTRIDRNRVVEEIARIAFSNITDFAEWDDEGNLKVKPSESIPREQAAAISEIFHDITDTKDGGVRIKKRFKLYDKIKGLELLAKHVGLLDHHGKTRLGSERPIEESEAEELSRYREELVKAISDR